MIHEPSAESEESTDELPASRHTNEETVIAATPASTEVAVQHTKPAVDDQPQDEEIDISDDVVSTATATTATTNATSTTTARTIVATPLPFATATDDPADETPIDIEGMEVDTTDPAPASRTDDVDSDIEVDVGVDTEMEIAEPPAAPEGHGDVIETIEEEGRAGSAAIEPKPAAASATAAIRSASERDAKQQDSNAVASAPLDLVACARDIRCSLLKSLNLHRQKIYAIPDSLCCLTNLTSLNLSSTCLSTLPSDVRSCVHVLAFTMRCDTNVACPPACQVVAAQVLDRERQFHTALPFRPRIPAHTTPRWYVFSLSLSLSSLCVCLPPIRCLCLCLSNTLCELILTVLPPQ